MSFVNFGVENPIKQLSAYSEDVAQSYRENKAKNLFFPKLNFVFIITQSHLLRIDWELLY